MKLYLAMNNFFNVFIVIVEPPNSRLLINSENNYLIITG